MSLVNLDWKPYLQEEFEKPYYKEITSFLKEKYNTKTIYPPQNKIFACLATPPKDVKVIIVGQDPYHGENQANGLAFSVSPGVKIPPSLKNIYKELEREYEKPMPQTGDLTGWSNQGVLLLNTSLSVEKGLAASHSGIGWQTFTDKIIKTMSDNFDNNVFILWGSHAKAKKVLIDESKHLILTSAHPSPFSVTGFLGNNHFLETNKYLTQHNKAPIDWYNI